MNPGIRAACTDDADRLIRNAAERLLDTLLHTDTALLALPSVVCRAVVFDAERDANEVTLA